MCYSGVMLLRDIRCQSLFRVKGYKLAGNLIQHINFNLQQQWTNIDLQTLSVGNTMFPNNLFLFI